MDFFKYFELIAVKDDKEQLPPISRSISIDLYFYDLLDGSEQLENLFTLQGQH